MWNCLISLHVQYVIRDCFKPITCVHQRPTTNNNLPSCSSPCSINSYKKNGISIPWADYTYRHVQKAIPPMQLLLKQRFVYTTALYHAPLGHSLGPLDCTHARVYDSRDALTGRNGNAARERRTHPDERALHTTATGSIFVTANITPVSHAPSFLRTHPT